MNIMIVKIMKMRMIIMTRKFKPPFSWDMAIKRSEKDMIANIRIFEKGGEGNNAVDMKHALLKYH